MTYGSGVWVFLAGFEYFISASELDIHRHSTHAQGFGVRGIGYGARGTGFGAWGKGKG